RTSPGGRSLPNITKRSGITQPHNTESAPPNEAMRRDGTGRKQHTTEWRIHTQQCATKRQNWMQQNVVAMQDYTGLCGRIFLDSPVRNGAAVQHKTKPSNEAKLCGTTLDAT